MELKLPLSVVDRADINQLLREIAALNDYFIAARAHDEKDAYTLPKISALLTSLSNENKHNLAEESQRAGLKANLEKFLKSAPVLNISFAAEPSPRAVQTILGWLRTNIHPQTLLAVGLQPSIAAGCVLRTPNKIFDLSLRTYLQSQESYLVKLIQGAAVGKR